MQFSYGKCSRSIRNLTVPGSRDQRYAIRDDSAVIEGVQFFSVSGALQNLL
jgi:hypothetical protein